MLQRQYFAKLKAVRPGRASLSWKCFVFAMQCEPSELKEGRKTYLVPPSFQQGRREQLSPMYPRENKRKEA